MSHQPPPGDEAAPATEANYWETAKWGPWPTRKNNFLAAGLACVVAVVLVPAVTLVMVIHYDGNALTSFVANLGN